MTTRAAVIHRSSTGTTRRFGEAIAAYLSSRGIEATAESIADCEPATLGDLDLVLLGCWTNGWFVIHQHPDEPWLMFARDLPDLSRTHVALFTTYKLATGSMFRRMREALERTRAPIELELASRDGSLGDGHRRQLDAWLASLTGTTADGA